MKAFWITVRQTQTARPILGGTSDQRCDVSQTTDAEAARKETNICGQSNGGSLVSPPIGPGLRDANEGDIAGYLSIQPMLAMVSAWMSWLGYVFDLLMRNDKPASSEVRQQIEFSDHIVVMNEPEKSISF